MSEKFGATGVGRFVMIMIAWKVFGDRLLGIVLGIPIWLLGLTLWWKTLQRFFFGYRTYNKASKDWIQQPPYSWSPGHEGRAMAGGTLILTIVAWTIAMMFVVFR